MTYSPFDLSGKVALVTGGNGGIGFGFAEALARAGADIAIWGTNEKKNADAKQKLEGAGVKTETFVCNVGDEGEVVETFKQTVEAMGKVDAVFANAGISRSLRCCTQN